MTDTKDTISLEEYGICEPYLASTRIMFYVLLHDFVINEIQLLFNFLYLAPKRASKGPIGPYNFTNKGIETIVFPFLE